MGIELERVLARLKESGGVPNVHLDAGVAREVLGALSVVDPGRVERGVEQREVAGLVAAG
ncbi:hypothetical protein TPA0598_04_03710 [Streptomyces lydicamycinicus]|uniref:Uncharacterized protein n=1 Tax=Streptomyces lydicamycinicus TaxID=1546107 RepID=A0A0P4R713_9ACTN|nr:hypothetical protein TPA0598_04_03710 [Streptomyces lydicamycinicus]